MIAWNKNGEDVGMFLNLDVNSEVRMTHEYTINVGT